METATGLSEKALGKILIGTDIPVPKVYHTVTSTNILAKEAAGAGEPEWSCIAASHQSAGRGRLGRSFYSPEGSGIYFSFILRPKLEAEKLTMLTTAAAVAVCMASEEEFGISPQIKWVNDVYLNDKKICGILTEAAFDKDGKISYAVVGVGINLTPPENGFPEGVSDVAGCLLSAPAQDAENRMLASFLKHCKKLYGLLETDSAFIADEYRRRCFIIGKEINIILAGKVVGTGVAMDTDSACRLLVRHTDGSTETLSAGEISIRLRLSAQKSYKSAEI